MAKIIAPNEQFSGERATVKFVNGVGETADPNLIAWFKSKGYQVEEFTEEEAVAAFDPTIEGAQTELTVAQIKEQLDALEIEYNKSAKKAKLLELLESLQPDPDAVSGITGDVEIDLETETETETDDEQEQ